MMSRENFKWCFLMVVLLIVIGSVAQVIGQDQQPILGLNYGPYRLEQSPWGPYPSEDEINEDMTLIAQKVSTIRIYSVQGVGALIVKLAQAHSINVVIQAWIGPDHENNEREIAKVIELAKIQPNVVGVLVGSEALLRKDVSVDGLIQYIQRVREEVPNNIPVGYADVFTSWDQNPQLAENVDLVGLHSYGFFSCRKPSEAAEFTLAQVKLLRENGAYASKKIVLFESGYPTSGARAGCETDTLGSEEAQVQVVQDMVAAAADAQLDLYIFQFADEPWKCYTGQEPGYGCHWGLINVDRTPKLAWNILSDRTSSSIVILYVQTSKDTAANCRAEATTEASIVEVLPNNTKVTVIGSEGDWIHVRTGEATCWIHNSLLVEKSGQTPTPPLTPIQSLTAYIQGADPNVCKGSSTQKIAAQGFTAHDSATIASCLRNMSIWKADAAAQQAARLQDGTCDIQPSPDNLTDYFKNNWALSDMSAMYFMIGLRLSEEGQHALATEAFQIILNEYSCGWIYDPSGPWFWSVKLGAQQRLGAQSDPRVTSTPGSNLQTIIQGADPSLCAGTKSEDMSIISWNADLPTAASCVHNVLQWESFARKQQNARLQNKLCDVQPANSDLDSYFADNWALSDIAITYFNLGRRLKDAGQSAPAREAFQTILDKYSCAWAWDPSGPWFWSLELGAREQLATLR